LAEAKLHCRVDLDDDDTLLTRLIVAARQKAEAKQKRALVTQTWDLKLDKFPAAWPITVENTLVGRAPIGIPLPPLQSIVSINYVDLAGNTQALSSSNYQVVPGNPGFVVPAYGMTWPSTRRQPDAVTVRFTAGYGEASAIPSATKAAIFLIVGHLYKYREEALCATIESIPMGVDALLGCEDWGHYA
jgi:uncharacterized phiE125 gp8 family phage protein